MIIVVADDITGAAEMGGIALRYGLSVLVSDSVNIQVQPDLLIIYTNARSMKKEEAVKAMEDITKKLSQLQSSLFYKKTDSVLRGYILAEMKIQMQVLGLSRGLLVPANPALNRIIKGGRYYINGQPIHETPFSLDPEFPSRSSQVVDLLGNEDGVVKVVAKGDMKTEDGILVGEAESEEDLVEWAKYDQPVLFAGGASFFNALLKARYQERPIDHKVTFSSPMLLVRGTKFERSVDQVSNNDPLTSYMPDEVFSDTEVGNTAYEKWSTEIITRLSQNKKCTIAIGTRTGQEADPEALRIKMAKMVRHLFEKIKIRELLVEGGSTTYTVVKELGWQSFIPTEELGLGIVRMQIVGLKDTHLTIKPGSYEWPLQVNLNAAEPAI
jgi:D-threonate/D-erythronate kinase